MFKKKQEEAQVYLIPPRFHHLIPVTSVEGHPLQPYLDEILMYSSSEVDHIWLVRVLNRLLNHQLFCKLENCSFHYYSTTFFAFTHSSEGLAMDPQKVQVVVHWTQQTSPKQLQSFLEFNNFHWHFIWVFSSVVAPLTSLTKPTNQPKPFSSRRPYISGLIRLFTTAHSCSIPILLNLLL